jgi:hypothetical protein
MEAQTCGYVLCACRRPYSPQNLATSSRRVDADAPYCSDRCEHLAEQNIRTPGCECGHPQCTPQTTNDIPPMQ